ncbi:MAG TPA: nicotinamide-nucleotide adenylyltransferase [Candidatus Gracilibacteria bacterium]|nr:nicotinamide-nucleotide adenylyltransferase [Candidatus Gracilibacteria bacterium]
MLKPLVKTGLFVGRFQPFHLGHLDIVKKILAENERIIIAIGSAEKNYVPENPLTAGERVLVIDETLKAAKINPARYTIIPVRNIDNYALWVDHLNLYVPPYNTIYTGSHIVKACYEGAQSKHRLVQIKRTRPVSGTDLRNSMISNTQDWEKLVHPRTAELLKKLHLPLRLRQINETMTETKYK